MNGFEPHAEHRERLLAHARALTPKSDRPPAPPMSPPRAAAYIQHADNLRAEGRLVEAIDALTRAAEGPRFAAHALRQRAELEEQLGNVEDAAITLKEALHRVVDDPRQSARGYAAIGDLYVRRGEPLEAAYYYRRALRLDPNDRTFAERLTRCERGAPAPAAPDLRAGLDPAQRSTS